MSLSNFGQRKTRAAKTSVFDSIPTELLLYTASGLFLIDLLIDFTLFNLILFACFIFIAAAFMGHSEFKQLLKSTTRHLHQGHLKLGSVIFLLIAVLWLLDLTAAPAHAQFFVGTEQWLRQSFPVGGTGGGTAGGGAGSTDIYALVFNTLRAIFVLYLAIALVRVIAAARNDEDWQNLARTPLIILVIVTLGDILASLIIGQGTGGA